MSRCGACAKTFGVRPGGPVRDGLRPIQSMTRRATSLARRVSGADPSRPVRWRPRRSGPAAWRVCKSPISERASSRASNRSANRKAYRRARRHRNARHRLGMRPSPVAAAHVPSPGADIAQYGPVLALDTSPTRLPDNDGYPWGREHLGWLASHNSCVVVIYREVLSRGLSETLQRKLSRISIQLLVKF